MPLSELIASDNIFSGDESLQIKDLSFSSS
jgi:hypothetical protein